MLRPDYCRDRFGYLSRLRSYPEVRTGFNPVLLVREYEDIVSQKPMLGGTLLILEPVLMRDVDCGRLIDLVAQNLLETLCVCNKISCWDTSSLITIRVKCPFIHLQDSPIY